MSTKRKCKLFIYFQTPKESRKKYMKKFFLPDSKKKKKRKKPTKLGNLNLIAVPTYVNYYQPGKKYLIV